MATPASAAFGHVASVCMVMLAHRSVVRTMWIAALLHNVMAVAAKGYNDTRHPVSRCASAARLEECREPPHDPKVEAASQHWHKWWQQTTKQVCNAASPVNCSHSKVVTVVTWADPIYRDQPWVQACLLHRDTYCQRHGLRCVVDDTRYTGATYFNKPYALKAALLDVRPNEYVLWADVDVLITGGATSIEQLVVAARLRARAQNNCDIVSTDDGNGVYGAGVILVRRSCYAMRWLDHWYSLRRWMRVEGDQAGYIVAVAHAALGYDVGMDDEQKRQLPCVYLDGPKDDLLSCVRRMRPCSRQPGGSVLRCMQGRQVPLSCPGSLCLARRFNTKLDEWTPNSMLFHAQGQQAKQCLLPMAKHLSEALDNAEQPMLIVRRRNCAQDEGRPLCSAFGHALCTTRSAHAVGAGDKPFWPLQGSNSSSTTARDSAERVTGALYNAKSARTRKPRPAGNATDTCKLNLDGLPFQSFAELPDAAVPCISYTTAYQPAAWEEWWMANVKRVATPTWKWESGCEAVRCMAPAAKQWMAAWRRSNGNPLNSSASWAEAVFSRHEVACAATGRLVATIAIEPLIGLLRHPWSNCLEKCPPCHHSASKDYIFPLAAAQVYPPLNSIHTPGDGAPREPVRAFLFDLGASLYRSGLGGSSQEFFVESYAARGIHFDRILAWEPKPYPDKKIIDAMPNHVYDVTSFFNVGVNADPEARINPLRTLRAITRPSDLVVLKIDIDSPEIEERLLQQIVEDSSLSSRVDELYYKDHVHMHPFMHGGPWQGGKNRTKRTLIDSYALFGQLRRLGIRAHSWV